MKLDCGYKLDILVAVLPVHEAKLVTDLKLTGKPVGLLLNFNVPVMKEGIIRKINA